MKLMMQKLQHLVNETTTWFHRWRLKPNPTKSQFLIFFHSPGQNSPSISFAGYTIKATSMTKYLGIHYDHRMTFKHHTSVTKRKIIRRSKYFRSLTYKTLDTNFKTSTKIYKSICRPLLEYGHPIFTNIKNNVKKIFQTAETTTLRCITKMRHPDNPLHNPPNTLLYEKTGIQPIGSRMENLNKRFASKPSNMDILEELCIKRTNYTSQYKHPQNSIMEILESLKKST